MEEFHDGRLRQSYERARADPLNQPSGTLTTTYAYDILNHLTTVTMPRATGTQTRTFNYTTGTTVGTLLLSATNPENGTVTYTYNTDKTLATKTDAKNQQFSYTYDSYKRVTQINLGQTVIRQFYYDTNPLDGSFSQNIAGRLTAVQNGITSNGDTFIEMYSYTQPGEVTKKRLRLSRSVQSHTITGDLDASYSYDNEGKMTSTSLDHLFGTPGVIDLLQIIASVWHHAYPDIDIGFGPISLEGGGDMGHKSHKVGVDVDVRPLRKDGKPLPTSIFLSSYSRDLTASLIGSFFYLNAFLTQVKVIFFNDSSISDVTRSDGHNDHFHVRFTDWVSCNYP